MANFPSKWFDFLNQKELKRLRRDVNNNFWLKLQIAISVVIAICSIVFSDRIKELCLVAQIILAVGLCLLVTFVFGFPFIAKRISILRYNNNKISPKAASTIFDEEIVYNVLVASEFYEIYITTGGSLSAELQEFYSIEIEYYLTTAISKLVSFNSNMVNIIGNEKILSSKRIKNITKIIDRLLVLNNITLDNTTMEDYTLFKDNIPA